MHGSVPRLEAWLQREVGDRELRLRWDDRTERYMVGRKVSSLTSDHVEWFYVVTDGQSGYRPIDQRTVRKIKSLDTWGRPKLTAEDFEKQIEERKSDEAEKRREVLQYRLRHEARYVKKAAQKDGLL